MIATGQATGHGHLRPASAAAFAAACALLIGWGAAVPGPAAALAPPDRMELANGLYARGLLDMALNEYLRLVEADPGFEQRDAALYRLGECYRRLDRIPEAAAAWQRLLEEHPQSAFRFRAALRRAGMDLDAGKTEAAEARLRAVMDDDPPPDLAAAAGYELGRLLLDTERGEEAEAFLTAVMEDHADTPFAGYAALALGARWQRDGERADAARALLEKAARHPAGGALAAEAWFLLGMHAFRSGDYESAARSLQRLLTDHPGHPRAEEALLPLAWSCFHAGRHLEALAWSQRIPARHPGADAALYVRANAHAALFQEGPAAAAYDRLLADHPDSPYHGAAAYERALLAYRAGRHREALGVLEGVEFPEGMREDITWLQAEAYASEQRRDEALESFRLLVERYPASERAPRAFYRMAHLLHEDGQPAAAYYMLRRLSQSYPDDELVPQALLEAAALMWAQEDYEQAVRDWSRLIENHPRVPQTEQALFRRALGQAKLQRDAPALDGMRRLLRDYPESSLAPQAEGWIGMLLARLEEWDAAEKALRAALARQTDEDWIRELRWRLAGVLHARGEHREAAELMQTLLAPPVLEAIEPNQLEWLARYQLEAGSWEEAAQAAATLTARAREPAWQEIGWYLAGRAYEALERPTDARRAYLRAAAPDAGTRESLEARIRGGFLALEEGDASAAGSAFEEILARVGAEDGWVDLRARAYQGLAGAAEQQRRPEDALRYYLAVSVLFDHPQWTPEAMARAAALLAAAGRDRESRDLLKELRERYPDHPAGEDPDTPP